MAAGVPDARRGFWCQDGVKSEAGRMYQCGAGQRQGGSSAPVVRMPPRPGRSLWLRGTDQRVGVTKSSVSSGVFLPTSNTKRRP